MDIEQNKPGLTNRVVSDLVLAELFLVQATIESASVIGDSLSELGDRASDEGLDSDEFSEILQRTAADAIEPYTTRFKYLRELISQQ